jgi:hypothetical protein
MSKEHTDRNGVATFGICNNPQRRQGSELHWQLPGARNPGEGGIAGTTTGGNQNYCLVLTDDGNFGRPHSSTATLETFNGPSFTGEFYVIGNNIFVNFVSGSSNGEASGLVLFAPANASPGQSERASSC